MEYRIYTDEIDIRTVTECIVPVLEGMFPEYQQIASGKATGYAWRTLIPDGPYDWQLALSRRIWSTGVVYTLRGDGYSFDIAIVDGGRKVEYVLIV